MNVSHVNVLHKFEMRHINSKMYQQRGIYCYNDIHSVMRSGYSQYDKMQYDKMQYDKMQYDKMQYDKMQYDKMQYDKMQYID
jgi:hypothetical protein